MLTIFLFMFLFVFGTTARAENDAALDLLQGYEWKLSEYELSRLGPEAYKAFLNIAQDETQVNFIRARAITTLTQFPNEEVWAYFAVELEAEQGDGNQAKIQRRRLVEGMCDSFLASRSVQVGEVLAPLLDANGLEVNDVHLKTKIAKCLQSVNSVQAGHALAEYRGQISEPWELKAAGFEKELE